VPLTAGCLGEQVTIDRDEVIRFFADSEWLAKRLAATTPMITLAQRSPCRIQTQPFCSFACFARVDTLSSASVRAKHLSLPRHHKQQIADPSYWGDYFRHDPEQLVRIRARCSRCAAANSLSLAEGIASGRNRQIFHR
jgi:hypothetical protein